MLSIVKYRVETQMAANDRTTEGHLGSGSTADRTADSISQVVYAAQEGQKVAAQRKRSYSKKEENLKKKTATAVHKKKKKGDSDSDGEDDDDSGDIILDDNSDSDDESSKKNESSTKTKGSRKTTSKPRKNRKKKKTSETDDEDEDDWGDMIIVKFVWREKAFQIKWSNNSMISLDNAMLVLQDEPEEALRVIWEGYHNNLRVREWINSVAGRFVDGWVDIEQYARERDWRGAIYVAAAAAAACETSIRENGQSQQAKPPPHTPQHNTQPNTQENTPPHIPKKHQKCQGFHHWEACNKTSYVVTGCLKGKSCHVCNVEFKGTIQLNKGKTNDKKDGYWPTSKEPVYHCVRCRIAYCTPCKETCDQSSPKRLKSKRLERIG